MIERTNMMNMRPTAAGVHAGDTEGARAEYYRAYYRELVTGHANLIERGGRLKVIKNERRRQRSRREKWLRGIKSLASVLTGPEASG